MRRKVSFYLAVLLLVFSVLILSCESSGTPQITVKNMKLIPSDALIGVASAYIIIANDGRASETLTGCSMKGMPAVVCKFHDVVDGKMVQLSAISIPAGQMTTLKKGGRHLMFYKLPAEFEKDVTVLLSFKKSGIIEVTEDTAKGRQY